MSFEVRNKLLERQRAAGNPGGTNDGKQYTSVRERLLSKTTEENIKNTKKKVSDWADKYNSVMKGVSDYQRNLHGGYTKDASGGYAKAIDELIRDYDGIKDYANRMGLPNAQRYLKQLQQTQSGIRNANAYMSQFLDEVDYNHQVSRENRVAALKKYDVAGNEAVSKQLNDAITEASGIREQLGIYQNDALTMLTQRDKVEALQNRLDDITREFGSLDEMKTKASGIQQDLGDAKRVQAGLRMAESAKADRNFPVLGGVNKANTDAKYRYINDENYRREYDAMVQKNVMEGHKSVNNFSEAGLDLMNGEERQLYNYYWAKGGAEAAETYLDSIREKLNSRKARTIYEDLSGDEWLDTAMKFAYGAEAGIDQWQSGAKGAIDMVTGKDNYVPSTAKQMASGMVREDLKDVGPKLPDWMGGASLGQMAYDAINTTANMAPSILASTVANVVVPGSGQVVGNIMLGGSALGGAYQDAINRGYDKGQAGLYASMIGASEVGLNYMLGGISKLGGVVSNGAVEAALSRVDNAILRAAGKIGGNMLSEGLEEGLQEIMTTWFSNIALGTSEKVSWDQVLYSGLMGCLTAGVFEGTDVVSGEVNVNTQGKDLKARGITGSQLADLGKTFDIGSKARELAERVNDSTDAYTMGRLFREVGAGLSDQNKADIAKSLMDKGMSQELAVKHAEIMEYIVEGGEVTNLQMQMIQKNDVLAQTMREVVQNAESTVGKRNSAFEAVQQAGVASDATVADGVAVSEPESVAEDNLQYEENEDYEAIYGGREDGKTYLKSTGKTVEPGKVTAIKDGKVTMEMQDGESVNADDVEFGDQEYDLVFRSITSAENMTPEGANTILQIYKQTGADMTASVYTEGAAQVYRQGYYGMKNTGAGLSSMQAEMIYSAGRRAAMENTRVAQGAVKEAAGGVAGMPGRVHFDGDESTLTERQRTSVKALDRVASALGVQIHLFESPMNERGKRTGANGWYDTSDGSIHIDIHAGDNGEGVMLYTAAHELTHHIKQWSPEKFKKLSDFLMTEYGEQDMDVDKMVRAQQLKVHTKRGVELSYDAAFEEVIASSMETMLADGRVVEKLEKLKQQDRSLWQQVKNFVADLASKIRAAYEGMMPDSEEGRYVADMKDSIDRLQDLFVEGLADASENYHTSGERNNGDVRLSDRSAMAENNTGFKDYDIVSAVYGIRSEKAQRHQDLVEIGSMPALYQDLFGLTGKVYVSNEHLYQNMVSRATAEAEGRYKRDAHADYHDLGEERAINAIEQFQNPIVVMESLKDFKEPRLVALLDEKGNDGNNLIAVLELYADKTPYGVSQERNHVLMTIYEKNSLPDYLRATVEKDRLLYVRERTSLNTEADLQSVGAISKEALNKNVARFIKKVKAFKEENNIQYQERAGESVSNRALLVNALESAAQTQEERLKLQEYRKRIETVEDAQRRLDVLNSKIREASFAPGKRDTAKIAEMRKHAAGLAETINNIDKKLLSLEASAPLKAVLEREKKKAYQRADQKRKEAMQVYREKELVKQKQIVERYQESRAKGIESRKRTAMAAVQAAKRIESVGAAPAGFDPITHWQYEYGMIPEGENPVRSDDLPVSTDGKNKVSYTARTVKGAKVTPDDFVDLLEQDIAKGGLTYMPITNNDTTQKAIEYITNYGWADAKAKWTADVRTGKASAEMSAIGALLLNNAAKAGDRNTWLDILHDYQHMGTNAGQAIQALRILKKLTPDDKLYMAQRSVDQMVEDMRLGTEITLDKDLKTEFLEAQTDEERNEILSKIQQNVANQIPATFMEKWTALRYLNMLGNLRTQIRNLTGNLGMKAVVSLKNGIATGLEQIVYLASGKIFHKTKSLVVSKEMKKAALEDFALVESLIQGGGKYSDAQSASAEFARAVQDKRRIFKNRFLEKYRKTTNWAMDAGDILFSRTAYARALAGYLKAHGMNTNDFSQVSAELMDEARLYAVQEAQEATFRDINWLSEWLSKIGRRANTPVVGKILSEGIMPFRKTPANVLIRAEEYSPLGIVNSLVVTARAMQKQADVTGNQVINSWAKTLTGTMLFGLGILLHSMGLLIGGPDEDDELDKFEDLNGWQNYALKIGDTTLTIDFLSPAAMPMFVGAQLNKMRQDGGIEIKEIEKAITALTDPMIQMSMLQGVNDTLENIRYAESNTGQLLINILASYLTQGMTNTLLGQLERSFEEQRMSTYVDKDSAVPSWMQRTLGKASAKIPGVDYNQVPYINAWGEEEKTPEMVLNMIYNLLSPSYVSKGTEDAVSKELARMHEVQSDINVFPGTPEKTITFTDRSGVEHKDYHLATDEYVALAKEQGQAQRYIIEKMIASKLYADLPDKYKAKAIQFSYKYAREHAQIEVLNRDGFTSDWMAEIKGDTANGILEHVISENIKWMYLDGDITAGEAMKRLVKYGGYEGAEAADKVVYWDFQADNPEYSDWEESTVIKYKNLDVETAARVVALIDELSVEDGYTNVRLIQKCESIVNTNRLSASEKDAALRAVMDDKLEEKYETAQKMGVGMDAFVKAYRKYQDTSGKGKKKAVTSWYSGALGLSKSVAEELYGLFAGRKKDE